jgi:hypothetical protein
MCAQYTAHCGTVVLIVGIYVYLLHICMWYIAHIIMYKLCGTHDRWLMGYLYYTHPCVLCIDCILINTSSMFEDIVLVCIICVLVAMYYNTYSIQYTRAHITLRGVQH